MWIDDHDAMNEINRSKSFVNEKFKFIYNNANIGNLSTCIRKPLKSTNEIRKHKSLSSILAGSSHLTNSFIGIKHYLRLFLNRFRNLAIIQTQMAEQ